MVFPLIWLMAGLAAPKIYERLSPETKKLWKTKYDLHHGEAGVLMLLGGAVTRNSGLSAFGAGLIIDDWKDRNKWFQKTPTDSMKNKTHTIIDDPKTEIIENNL